MSDFRMAYIISTICNVNRSKKQKAFKPRDFMPSEIAKKNRKKTTNQLHESWKVMMAERILPPSEQKADLDG